MVSVVRPQVDPHVQPCVRNSTSEKCHWIKWKLLSKLHVKPFMNITRGMKRDWPEVLGPPYFNYINLTDLVVLSELNWE